MHRLRIAYARVSTDTSEQQQSLSIQQSLLQSQGVDRILSDVESGLNPARTGYQELRRLISVGHVSEVLATEFSRLGRNAIESDQFILLCDAAGVTVRTISDGVITMATAEAMIMTRLRSSMAQAESMRLSTRIRRGQAEARKQGRPLRRPPWGYRSNRATLEPDPVEFTSARAFIDALRAMDWRIIETLRSYPEPIPLTSVRTARYWISSPVIRGGLDYRRSGLILWDQHPPLLTHDEFQAYRTATSLRRRSWGANSNRPIRPLTSLCICATCSAGMKYYAGRNTPSLRCNRETCIWYYRSIREAVVIDYAVEQLRTHAAAHLAAAATSTDSPQVLELRRQIEQLERLADPDLAAAVEAKRQRLEQLQAVPQIDSALVERIADPAWWQQATVDELTVILHATIARITVDMEQREPVAVAFQF